MSSSVSAPTERGFTLLEIMVVVALAAVLVAIAVLVSMPMIGKESGRSAVYEIQTMAQLSRMEAVARNRESRLLLCPSLRQVLVTDSLGTSVTTDDQVLHSTTLPRNVTFERPDIGAAVTWESLGGSPAWFGVRFASDGTIEAGEGDVVVHGGDRYVRISLYTAGSAQVTTWSNGAWRAAAF
jgi:prepilin-type N-terminal cleavage/methylation domain-containing protein